MKVTVYKLKIKILIRDQLLALKIENLWRTIKMIETNNKVIKLIVNYNHKKKKKLIKTQF